MAEQHRFAGMTVRQVLLLKKGSVRSAPLPPGSSSWDDVLDLVWEEIDEAARRNVPGFKTIRKLLADQRFDR
jgi:hypothetical protein